MDIHKFLKPYRVDHGDRFRLKDFDPRDINGFKSKEHAQDVLRTGVQRLAELQDKLYAQDCWALLLIFQALDAAGKDGTIKHVMSGIIPQVCQFSAVKAPSVEDLDHDYLWRTARCIPERGRIGIFNRSYYEEVLVVKVHPDILDAQRLPEAPAAGKLWHERYESIRDFEKHLARNGTTILKFFLNVSKGEQRRRLLDRIDDPEANWKFQPHDVQERRNFGKYLAAYDAALRETSRPWAPWYAVPADDKDYMRRIVAEVIVDTLRAMDLHYPVPDRAGRLAMASARKALESEK